MKLICFLSVFIVCFPVRLFGSSSLWKPVEREFDQLNNELEEIMRKDESPVKAASFIKEMRRIASQKKNKTMFARLHYWESWTLLKKNDNLAEKLIIKAVSEIDSVEYEYDYARLRFNLGTVLINRGSYLNAFILYKNLEQYFNQANDYLFAGKCCINIAYILNAIREPQRSLLYLQKAETFLIKGKHVIQATKSKLNIASIFSLQHRDKEAIRILDRLLADTVTQKDSVFLISVLVALDCAANTVPEHFEFSFKAYQIARKIQNNSCLAYTSTNLGNYYVNYKPMPDSALFYYKKAYAYSMDNTDAYSIPPILYGLSKCYALSGQTDSAYHYLNKYTLFKDSISGNNNIAEINKTEGRMAIEKYESELRQAKEREEWNRKITIVILLSVLFLATLTCYIFWLLRKKEKFKKQLREAENRELSENLSSKNRELTSNTLVITEKNQTLKILLKEIEKLEENNCILSIHANKLKKEIKSHLDKKDEWQYFKIHFESVYPDFFLKLKREYPVLSENDLRLCAYIRISMTTKEISQMLSILPETVNMARYRMRKKLELAQEQSLEDFIRKF